MRSDICVEKPLEAVSVSPAVDAVFSYFGKEIFHHEPAGTLMETLWLPQGKLLDVMRFLRRSEHGFDMLFDLHAVDERLRRHRPTGLGQVGFSVFYQLVSLRTGRDLMIKVGVDEAAPKLPSITAIWPAANWYEREVYDMFGIVFEGHPCLKRLLMPPGWQGHPLRKDYAARATEHGPYILTPRKQDEQQARLRFVPEEWGLARGNGQRDYMFLNFGPNHPSAHGAFRLVLQLDGEEVLDCVPDIGYHHRGAEKMAERQSWHSYIPYTDRIDYTGGVVNNLPYLLALEALGDIPVPQRAQTIRVMLTELFRITSHLLFFGTYVQDLGAMTPVFFTFTDRQKAYGIIEAITGFRMHPAWFRIGGVAADLPKGWDALVEDFLAWMPKRLDEYQKTMMENATLRERAQHVAAYTSEQALEWGVTGPNLRATGFDFDARRDRPYSGYENFSFEVPLGKNGDVFDRGMMRLEEMRQSLRIIAQCLKHMPSGAIRADHPLSTPPARERMKTDIETLIRHFQQISWGARMPVGESMQMIEATKGLNSYYIISDGGTMSYRTRIRTPSFAHLQQIPEVMRGGFVPDMVAHIASIDFVMADVDR